MSARGKGSGSRALQRLAAGAWPLLQGTAAATAAWLIAKEVLGHEQPFFAPIAAFIGLNAAVGERGLNAVRLLLGVIVGIAVGELTVLALGGGYGRIAVAVFGATAIAVALGGERIVVAQAAASAILTVVAADGEEGAQRLIDALIGGGVALLFTQLLFSPEPVKLLRGAEAAALRDMAKGLELTAEALERDDDEFGERALTTLRDLRDRLTELSRVRQASGRVARRSAVWRSQRAPVVRENENAGHLDLLGGSCLMLTRAAIATSPPVRRRLAPSVRELADALTRLAREPGDRATRQAAVDRALAVSRDPGGTSVASDAPLAAIMTVRTVAADLMTFAGVDADQAVDAVREGTGEFDIPTPAPAPRTPLRRPGHRF